MQLKWITKTSGQYHYCYDEDDKIIGYVYESFSNSICQAYSKDDNENDFIVGHYIKLSSAKKAVEQKYQNKHSYNDAKSSLTLKSGIHHD